MAEKNDILNSLLNQPPYRVPASTEDFIVILHQENLTPQDFTDKFNDAVKRNLRFKVVIHPDSNPEKSAPSTNQNKLDK